MWPESVYHRNEVEPASGAVRPRSPSLASGSISNNAKVCSCDLARRYGRPTSGLIGSSRILPRSFLNSRADFSVRRSRTSCNVATLSSIHGRGGALKTLSRLWRSIPSSDVNPWTFCQECFWYNPAKMPTPAEWVNVRRVRIKDSVEYVWWLSKTPWPKADNRNVLNPYSKDMIRLKRRGVRGTVRPSGHNIKSSFDKIDAGGSIPPNVVDGRILPDEMLRFGNNSATDTYTNRCKEAGVKICTGRGT